MGSFLKGKNALCQTSSPTTARRKQSVSFRIHCNLLTFPFTLLFVTVCAILARSQTKHCIFSYKVGYISAAAGIVTMPARINQSCAHLGLVMLQLYHVQGIESAHQGEHPFVHILPQ
ncbi:hypothetical protein ACHAWX_006602 [Stephanocyclus meneghinianus]